MIDTGIYREFYLKIEKNLFFPFIINGKYLQQNSGVYVWNHIDISMSWNAKT